MSAVTEQRYVWTTRGWKTTAADDPADGPPLVADSWRVREGRVRGVERHRARFLGSVAERHPDAGTAFTAALDSLPLTGDWFPRIELRHSASGSTLVWRIRPAPPTTTEVLVATADNDPRTHPLVKGPDLDALQELRVAVQAQGAGEAVILDAAGHVVEGAYCALLWWRGDTLVQPETAKPRIPSVTAAIILDAARANGVSVTEEAVTPAALEGCELWALSALHGLRHVTRWIDGPRLGAGIHVERGRDWLAAATRPLRPAHERAARMSESPQTP